MLIRMLVTYDEPKRLINLVKHDGRDFASLTGEFFEHAAIFEAKHYRFVALG